MGLAAATTDLEWGECIVPAVPVPPALRAEVRKAVGAVPGWLARLAPSPWLVRALCEIIKHPFAHAPREVCELVALVVSQENSCRYCYGVQRAVFKIFGYRDAYLDALERDAQVSELTPAARAALDFARRLTRATPRPSRADLEARRFVAAEGLAPGQLDEILANLGSPQLDAREARLVPFARETVRYQPAAVQRRMRELAHGLTAEEIVEAVGVAALANAVCRMSVVIDAC